jgi:hypothetical protein
VGLISFHPPTFDLGDRRLLMMRTPLLLLTSVILAATGLFATGSALLRLGWMRHGFTNLPALHSERLGELSKHPAHRDNILSLAAGLVLLLIALLVLRRTLRR